MYRGFEITNIRSAWRGELSFEPACSCCLEPLIINTKAIRDDNGGFYLCPSCTKQLAQFLSTHMKEVQAM